MEGIKRYNICFIYSDKNKTIVIYGLFYLCIKEDLFYYIMLKGGKYV